ncbi:MAG: triose-phosphate isomerase [Bacteroidales bacterium]
MREKIVAGNWKMNSSIDGGETLVKEIIELMKQGKSDVTLIVAPPFTHLERVSKRVAASGASIAVAAQNCAHKEWGAYTGEVSAKMLKELSCQYVIIGHSERREYFGEGSDLLLMKCKEALAAEMKPIFCVGERLQEREQGEEFNYVSKQIREVLFHLSDKEMEQVVVAYEPVWAIGTGKTATAAQAQEMHSHIRGVIAEKFGERAKSISILYGGSCNPTNAKELFSQESVDGGLIGGASLKSDQFIAIANSF